MSRFFATLALTIAALIILAWPLSRLGVTHTRRGIAAQTSVTLAKGALRLQSDTLPPPGPLAREHFLITAGTPGAAPEPMWLPAVTRSATSTQTVVPLSLPLFGSLIALGAIVTTWWVRARRRRRHGRCLACGYQRGSEGPCQECGLGPAEAAAGARPPISRIVRDAGVGVFAVVFVLCGGAWLVMGMEERADRAHRASIFDYSWYLDACQPRLSGVVTFAAPGSGPDNLMSAVQAARPGTVIVLLPGHHTLGDPRQRRGVGSALKDLWLFGSGQDTTSLSALLEQAERIRIEGVTIECGDQPFCDLRRGCTVQLRDCRVRGYNSGAGGSNAIFGSDTVLLIEGGEFEGKTGRASGSMRGNAFDLRGTNRIFVRGTRFTDNQSIFRDAEGVMDGCPATTDQPQSFVGPSGSPLFARNSTSPTRTYGAPPTPFAEALDDVAALERLSRGDRPSAAYSDGVARQAATALRLGDGDAYWRRLLMHPAPEVRRIASAHVRLPPPAVPGLSLEEAVTKLDQAYLPREVVLAILTAGDGARAGLKSLMDSGSAHEKGNAAALMQLMGVQPALPELLRSEQLRQAR